MASQMVFRRRELKYLMTRWQREQILLAMEPYMSIDSFGHSEIRNLYYDTPDFRLIRTSLEHPIYKEKLRLRTYGQADTSTPAYLELKKKYMGVVYKRRISLPYPEALCCLSGQAPLPDSQIGREIAATLDRYGSPQPRVFLRYEREAFYDRGGSDFRVTFDEDIRWRTENLTLTGDCSGAALLPPDWVLMELKVSQSLPMWMVRKLSELSISKTTFSKYGSAYTQLLQTQKGLYHYA